MYVGKVPTYLWKSKLWPKMLISANVSKPCSSTTMVNNLHIIKIHLMKYKDGERRFTNWVLLLCCHGVVVCLLCAFVRLAKVSKRQQTLGIGDL